MRIAAVCGSLQGRSSNRALLRAAAAAAPEGVEVLLLGGLRELPFFDPDLESGGAPPAVEAWRRALAECDAVLFASPEYGHSLPGVLKNGIDWVIGSGELYRKIVAITAAVRAAHRGRMGLQALAQTLGAVDANVVWNAPVLHDRLEFGPEIRAPIDAIVDALRRRG